jgi:restriction system protein
LMQFPEFVEFQKVERKDVEQPGQPKLPGLVLDTSVTPTELLDASYRNLRGALAAELVDRVKQKDSKFFEDLVLDLLVAMGYGGSRKDAERVGRSHDGGIDGTINEDKLGLDVVYVQAKRWDEGTVGRKEVQAFAGSLEDKHARKGVFIATSKFTDEARQFVKGIEKKIILIDGDELAQLMIDFGIAVAEVQTYAVKKVDEDYFA